MAKKNTSKSRIISVAATYGPRTLGTFFLCSSLMALFLLSIFSSKGASFALDALHPSTAMLVLISYFMGLVPSVIASFLFTALAITATSFRLVGIVGMNEGALLGLISGIVAGLVTSGSVSFTALCAVASLVAGFTVGWRRPLNAQV